MKYIVLFVLGLLTFIVISCSSSENPIEIVLSTKSEHIQKVMRNPEDYELQIIYTEINRIKNGKINLTDYTYNVSEQVYFYPASSVKLPIVLLTLEKLKKLQQKGIPINRKTWFKTPRDSTYTTLEKAIKDILIISDNHAYNNLFDF